MDELELHDGEGCWADSHTKAEADVSCAEVLDSLVVGWGRPTAVETVGGPSDTAAEDPSRP